MKVYHTSALLSFSASACLMLGFGQAAFSGDLSTASAESMSQKVTLPSHTLVLLSLDQNLRSGQQSEGETVAYRVDADVKAADGSVLIAAGAPAYGKVLTSKGVGGFGKNGRLAISCEYAVAVDGSHVEFADPEFKKSGGGNQLSTILFMPIVALPFSKGHDIRLERGMPLTMTVEADSSIAPVSAAAQTAGRTVQVLEHGKHKKPYEALVKTYTPETVTVTTDSVDRELKIKDLSEILPSDGSQVASGHS